MNEQVLDYSFQTNSGTISGDDGNRYDFAGAEWKEPDAPAPGMRVDFDAEGNNAIGIYVALDAPVAAPTPVAAPAPASAPSSFVSSAASAIPSVDIAGTVQPFSGLLRGENDRMVAALLAIVLGWTGIHKFYLGNIRTGVMQAMGGFVGLQLFYIISGAFGFLGSFIDAFSYVAMGFRFIGILILIAMGAIGVAEGAIYITKSDEDFREIYVDGDKQWF